MANQNHHLVPISILGPDVPQNIASISEEKHKELHNILDMNSRLHYKLVREARAKTNHKIIMTHTDLRYRHDAQKLYFERVGRLELFLRKVHLEKMNQLVGFEKQRLSYIGTNIKQELISNFDEALKLYHELGLQLAKETYLIFKKGLGHHHEKHLR